ncbi:MAG: AAA family ATPase [Lentisphaerae bacterium]|nr:AAA family ATPase [Lentisphaerota bacterium]
MSEDDISITAPFSLNKIRVKYDEKILSWQIAKKIPTGDSKIKSDYRMTDKYINTLHDKLNNTSDSALPILIYYQTNRSLSDNSTGNPRLKQKNYTTAQCYAYENNFRKKGNDFNEFINWFRLEEDWENQNKLEKGLDFVNPNLNVVRNAIHIFFSEISSNDFSNLKVKRIKRDGTYHYGTYNLQHTSSLVIQTDNQELKINQLSDGQKILLLMVSDLAHRLAVANPCSKNPLQGNGIVLIDEIELHLHPQWQREVIPGLVRTFPNLQFIVATHSPHVLSSMEKEEVFILEDCNIVKITPHTKGRDINSVLYELQGVEERPKSFKEKLKKLYRLTDDEQIENARELLQELTEKWGEEDTEIIRLNMHLNYLTAQL